VGVTPYPPLADYALIGDCRSAALVSRGGSIDWACLPRFDSGSTFGRLLDWERGGHCAFEPEGEVDATFREYMGETLVLVTRFRSGGGEARLIDLIAIPGGDLEDERRHLLRIVEGESGSLDFRVRVEPRFDYGEIAPWIRHHAPGVFSAIGGDDGLVVRGDVELEPTSDRALEGRCSVRPGERRRLSLTFERPERIDAEAPQPADSSELDGELDRTVAWWREWAGNIRVEGPDAPGARRSALVLKALSYAPTGALAAAATTSLPESPDGERTWDYRFTWIRDSALSARSFARLGCEDEADAFRRFVERTAAGSAGDLRILYGVGGERRLPEVELGHLEGWRGARPVRIGNGASGQTQLDALGQLVDQSWRWHQRGHSPDDDYWRFILDLVDTAAERWRDPDAGIWEWRGEPKHFVHSKVLCWTAVDRGLRLAEECMRKAPERRWREARDEIREAIESEGYDEDRGVFVQAFGEKDLDSALLRLPTVEFVDWADERMVRTADAIRDELSLGGLLRRYANDDGLEGKEGAFLACSFWLTEVYARQGRLDEAREVFDRTVATANGLGLFSEEYEPDTGEMLGNFPQALTHLSHIEAVIALTEAGASEAEGVSPSPSRVAAP
jgi:GH15 family glucan-1,4-alpha-glucosidase